MTNTEVTDWKDVRATEFEHEEHVRRPLADPKDGGQPLGNLVVGESLDASE